MISVVLFHYLLLSYVHLIVNVNLFMHLLFCGAYSRHNLESIKGDLGNKEEDAPTNP